MEPINILVLIPRIDKANSETIVMNYMRNLDRDIIKYDFMVDGPDKLRYEDEIVELGGKVYHMGPLVPLKRRKYKNQFRRFLKTHPYYQIIHSHLEEKSHYALQVAAEVGVPIRIAHGHSGASMFNLRSPIKYYHKYRLKKVCTDRMACSREVGTWLFGKQYRQKIYVMKNAIDIDQFKRDSVIEDEVRREFGITDQIVIGHIGKFMRRKNQKYLVDIFADIIRVIPNAILLLVSEDTEVNDNHYKKKVVERIEDMRLEKSVILTDKVEEINRLMQVVDVLVMPSRKDGFPIELVEAQSLGVKCVVSDNISYKCDLAGNIEFVPLELRSTVWSNKVIKMINTPFKDETYKVFEKGFDIKENARQLQEYYIKRIEEASES